MKMISIETNEFRQPIANAVAKGIKVVIWHQIPASGGDQQWFLIQSIGELDKIITRGSVASAFTAYEWIDVKTPQTVDPLWLEQIAVALEQEVHNRLLLISTVTRTQEIVEPVKLTWIGELEDVQKYFEEHAGSEVMVGRIPSFSVGEIIRGYFPDANGNPTSGPY